MFDQEKLIQRDLKFIFEKNIHDRIELLKEQDSIKKQ